MKRVLAIASLLIAAPSVLAAEWTEDFAAAKKSAAESHKDLLIDFTGSDWYGYCMMLDAEVFKKDEFSKVVPQSFVLVKIDSPRDPSRQSAAIREQNTKLSGIYSVEGLPTVVLADAEGRPYATTGYKEDVIDEGQDDQATIKLIDEIIHIAPDTATAADLRDLRKEINE